MKKEIKTYLLIINILIIYFLFTSCEKSKGLYNPDNVRHTSELTIPSGFNWQMTRTEACTISADADTYAAIFEDEACSENKMLAKILVSSTPKTLELELPIAAKAFYIQYPAKGGAKEVMKVDVAAVTKANTVIKLPENVDYTKQEDEIFKTQLDNHISRGTIMFEDNWPDLGDYDFNDFVIYYNTIGKISRGAGSDPDVYENEGMEINVQFRAIGGQINYQLGLQLDYMPAKYIDSYDLSQNQNIVEVKFLNPGEDGPAVFIFEGSSKLKGKNGAQYYNTEKGYEIAKEDLVTATIKFKSNCYNNLTKNNALYTTSLPQFQNFFITNNDKEIHLRGYSPTANYQNYDNDADDLMSETSYYSKKGFVWGIKVPADTKHATELTDFIEAYPQFKEWVTSGGTKNTNWYNNPDKEKIITE